MIAGLAWGDLATLLSLALTIGALLNQVARSIDRLNTRLTDLALRVEDLEQALRLGDDEEEEDDASGPH